MSKTKVKKEEKLEHFPVGGKKVGGELPKKCPKCVKSNLEEETPAKKFLSGLVQKEPIVKPPIKKDDVIPKDDVISKGPIETTPMNYSRRNVCSTKDVIVDRDDLPSNTQNRGVFKLRPDQPIKN